MTIDITGGTISRQYARHRASRSGDTLNFALGAGTFTYNSSFTSFDTVNINSGTVVLNGASNSAAAVNVNSGGTLAGNGTYRSSLDGRRQCQFWRHAWRLACRAALAAR